MKTKKQIIRLTGLKLLLILPVITTILVLFPSCSGNKNNEAALEEIAPPPVPSIDEIYADVDEMPVFKDGEAAILQYITKNTIYPEEAKKNNIEGRVLVKFVVEKDCTVSNVEILEGDNQLLNNEALRVVKSLPKFEKAAYESGAVVRVYFLVPISFTLE